MWSPHLSLVQALCPHKTHTASNKPRDLQGKQTTLLARQRPQCEREMSPFPPVVLRVPRPMYPDLRELSDWNIVERHKHLPWPMKITPQSNRVGSPYRQPHRNRLPWREAREQRSDMSVRRATLCRRCCLGSALLLINAAAVVTLALYSPSRLC